MPFSYRITVYIMFPAEILCKVFFSNLLLPNWLYIYVCCLFKHQIFNDELHICLFSGVTGKCIIFSCKTIAGQICYYGRFVQVQRIKLMFRFSYRGKKIC